jgi:hypothetical protein
MPWFVLGFSSDDIIGGSQDMRLAESCNATWIAAGRNPPRLRIWQGPGEGEHFIYWYLDMDVAQFLDRHSVDWRRFIVGERGELPAAARPLLDLGE